MSDVVIWLFAFQIADEDFLVVDILYFAKGAFLLGDYWIPIPVIPISENFGKLCLFSGGRISSLHSYFE